MIAALSLVLVLIYFVGPAGAASTALTIVAFGDSLTSGHGLRPGEAYPAELARMMGARGLSARVVNHGVSGSTTAQSLRRLDAALAEKPSILIVGLGANDGLRGVPVAQMRANLEAIIERAQAGGAAVLLCGMEAFPLYGWEYTRQFHDVFPALAAKYHVPLVPFMLQGVFGNQAMLQPDMVHPNAAGAARIATTIWTYLEPILARSAAKQS